MSEPTTTTERMCFLILGNGERPSDAHAIDLGDRTPIPGLVMALFADHWRTFAWWTVRDQEPDGGPSPAMTWREVPRSWLLTFERGPAWEERPDLYPSDPARWGFGGPKPGPDPLAELDKAIEGAAFEDGDDKAAIVAAVAGVRELTESLTFGRVPGPRITLGKAQRAELPDGVAVTLPAGTTLHDVLTAPTRPNVITRGKAVGPDGAVLKLDAGELWQSPAGNPITDIREAMAPRPLRPTVITDRQADVIERALGDGPILRRARPDDWPEAPPLAKRIDGVLSLPLELDDDPSGERAAFSLACAKLNDAVAAGPVGEPVTLDGADASSILTALVVRGLWMPDGSPCRYDFTGRDALVPRALTSLAVQLALRSTTRNGDTAAEDALALVQAAHLVAGVTGVPLAALCPVCRGDVLADAGDMTPERHQAAFHTLPMSPEEALRSFMGALPSTPADAAKGPVELALAALDAAIEEHGGTVGIAAAAEELRDVIGQRMREASTWALAWRDAARTHARYDWAAMPELLNAMTTLAAVGKRREAITAVVAAWARFTKAHGLPNGRFTTGEAGLVRVVALRPLFAGQMVRPGDITIEGPSEDPERPDPERVLKVHADVNALPLVRIPEPPSGFRTYDGPPPQEHADGELRVTEFRRRVRLVDRGGDGLQLEADDRDAMPENCAASGSPRGSASRRTSS